MRIVCIGGGPAGLYFAALMKKADPAHDITVVERNRPDDTFGFGVVFSDATLEHFAQADRGDARRDRPRLRSLGRHRHPLARHRGDLDGPRLRRALPPAPPRHPPAAVRDLGVRFSLRDRGARSLAVSRRGPDPGRRRRQQRHPGPSRRALRPPDRVAPEPVRVARHDLPVPGLHLHLQGGRARAVAGSRLPLRRGSTPPSSWRRPTRRGGGRASTRRPRTTRWRSREELFADELEGPPARSRTARSGGASRPSATRAGRTATSSSSATPPTPRTSRSAPARSSPWRTPSRSAAALGDATPSVGAALAAYEAERRPEVESLQRAAQVSLEWFEDDRALPWPSSPSSSPSACSPGACASRTRTSRSAIPVRRDAWTAGSRRGAAQQSGAAARRPPARVAAADVHAVPAAGPRARRTGSSSRRCASTRPRTGTPNDWHLVHLGSRARGRAGAGVAEMTDVSREGRISPGCTGMYKPEHVDAWRRIVDFVHRHTGRRIAPPARPRRAQGLDAAHVGGDRRAAAHGNWPLVSASPLPYFPHSQIPREMTARRHGRSCAPSSCAAAAMAEEAGFDMLELHMAHGYLLASFLSPLTNLRTRRVRRRCWSSACATRSRSSTPCARPGRRPSPSR